MQERSYSQVSQAEGKNGQAEAENGQALVKKVKFKKKLIWKRSLRETVKFKYQTISLTKLGNKEILVAGPVFFCFYFDLILTKIKHKA